MHNQFKYIDDFSKHNENTELDRHKIQWLKVFKVSAKTESKIIGELTDKAKNELYNVYFFNDNNINYTLKRNIDKNIPILRYGAGNANISLFISKMGLSPECLYNKPDYVKISGDKARWHMLFNDKPYIPKTVFTKKEALSELTFPIVAKPSAGHSGIGIVKFSDDDSLKNSTSSYDLYSEWVKSVGEFRALFVKDNLCLLYERIPRIDMNKTVETKKKNEEVQFIYIEQDMKKFPLLQQIKDICIDMRKLLPLDVFSLDFLVDKNDKIWILENNSNSGLAAMSLAALYLGIYRDFYRMDPPKQKMEIVDDIITKYREEIKKMYPGEYAKSKYKIE